MPDFERSQQLPVDVSTAYDYLSDPSHLPDFIATMSSARQAGPDGLLHVTAEVHGRHEEGDAAFRADPGSRTISWGDAAADYHGSIQVHALDQTTSSAHLALHTRDDAERRGVERALDMTMANLADSFGR